MAISKETELAELHVHLGGSVDPATMWEIAHSQGIRLPTKDYWKFADMITVNHGKVKTFEEYLTLFKLTELIQSSPIAVERSVYQTIAGAYRKNNITYVELRYNPMKRNRGGEQDLDQIIMASIRGIERAMMEYPIKAGIIVCLDKTFPYRQNEILVEKAIKYQSRGVVGIDMADSSKDFKYSNYKSLYKRAKQEGLGLTIHAGEDDGHNSVIEAVENLEPDRIGHGVKAAEDPETLDMLNDHGVTLEVCPTSNLHTSVVKDIGHMRKIFNELNLHKVKYTINTDGPEMLVTHLRNEFDFLLKNNILAESDIAKANKQAFLSSFLKQ